LNIHNIYHCQYRSPEEYRGDSIDEKIDVFSMGNNIYTLLTGLWPYGYPDHSYSYAITRVQDGIFPHLDPRYATGELGLVESRLAAIMVRMWAHDPVDRPDIFEVVRYLRQVKEEYQVPSSRPPSSD
jgi:hypothetical protein